MKRIKLVETAKKRESIGCGECRSTCQSACKTSCTEGNQSCVKINKEKEIEENR